MPEPCPKCKVPRLPPFRSGAAAAQTAEQLLYRFGKFSRVVADQEMFAVFYRQSFTAEAGAYDRKAKRHRNRGSSAVCPHLAAEELSRHWPK